MMDADRLTAIPELRSTSVDLQATQNKHHAYLKLSHTNIHKHLQPHSLTLIHHSRDLRLVICSLRSCDVSMLVA